MTRSVTLALVVAACSGSSQHVLEPQDHTPPPPPAPTHVDAAPLLSLATLHPADRVHGFRVDAVYTDDAGRRRGARFVHLATQFAFDYLQIESAPQAHVWVDSFPTSDKGEPHTQEHLLLTKGDRGRRLGSMEAMALAESNAFTEQWRTSYSFNTVASHDTFWPVLENTLDAMLYPDYTDEEIRREVRHFGVDKHADGTLHVDEKGTVYNEMVRAYETPDAFAWRQAGQLAYGASHPLALESGGFPDAIRTMTPADIRAFHDAAYHLANMGMVGAFPSAMQLPDVLDRTSAILDNEHAREQPHAPPAVTETTIPPAQPAAVGTIVVGDGPAADATTPVPLIIAWPATRTLSEVDRTLLELLLDAVAGDPGTPLYEQLVDSSSRLVDLEATAVHGMVSSDVGHPVYIWLDGVRGDRIDKAAVEHVRGFVLAEMKRLAAMPDGGDVASFDAKLRSRITARRRDLAKMLDTPPRFGFRGTGAEWMWLLHQLEAGAQFERSLTMKPALDAADAVLASQVNPWRDRLAQWGLVDAPYGVAMRPSPKLRATTDAARQQRNADELARLTRQYGKDALPAFQKDYDALTAKTDAAAREVPLPPLVAGAPLTLDDDLHYTVAPIAGIPALTATFETMASARVDLALPLDGVADADLFYLAALPDLLTGAGLAGDAPMTAAQMREQLRKDVLSLDASFDESPRLARHELVVGGSGGNAGELLRAVRWMRQVLTVPDWRAANLPRLRDIVAQQLAAARDVMQGSEEGWAPGVRDAWWRQDDPLHLHTRSVLTRAFDLYRLRWMLLDAGDAKAREAAARYVEGLGRRGGRAAMATAARALADGKDPAAGVAGKEIGKDLGDLLAQLPDDALLVDSAMLCKEIARDLTAGPDVALAGLDRVRVAILHASQPRLVLTGATSTLRGAGIAGLAQLLTRDQAPVPHAHVRAIAERLHARVRDATDPRYVGLVDPGTASGVFLDTAPAPGYLASSDDDALDYLTSNLYTGHGAHSVYSRTLAVGMAYSNGIHPQPRSARLEYYAERCPRLAQTIGFVVGVLRDAQPDPNIARYALAKAFDARVAESYEERASAMDADLADGVTPDVVRAFRTKLLALAGRQDLAAELFKRMPRVYSAVLPGLGERIDKTSGAVSFVIGPDKQLTGYQEYLHAAVGKDITLYRLYPRDFWTGF